MLGITNDRVIAIGSADTQSAFPGEDTTYVDILELRYVQGVPNAVHLASCEKLSASPTALTRMGHAHDVAITPDGGRAVVSHNNWVHFFDMATGLETGALNLATQAGYALTPYFSRNSIEVTNTRAIVAFARPDGVPNLFDTDVFILNLATDPPTIGLHDAIPRPPSLAGHDLGPHDIAITPNGYRAVVTTSARVVLYDLTNFARLGSIYEDGNDNRRWGYISGPDACPDLWDSVEVSNDRAVVVANRPTEGWSVRVFDISGALGQPIVSWLGASASDTAWDAALSLDGKVAVVKTQLHDLGLLDVVNPTATNLFRAGPTAGPNSPTSSAGFPGVNDGAALMAPAGSDPDQQQRWAAFIGRVAAPSANAVKVRFYDLSASSWTLGGPSALQFVFAESTATPPYLQPADVELATGGTDVLFRTTAPMLDSGVAGGVDWTRWTGNPPGQVLAAYGGMGVCVAVDSLRVRRDKSVSISWDHDSPGSAGFIHIVTIQ